MKKKILSFMLAVCLIVPCMLFLSACNNHEHEYNSEWTINESHHWHKCEKCDEKQVYEEHEFNNAWTINESHHWHNCKQCNAKQGYEEHDWDNGVIITQATPTQNGVKLFICNDCKTTKTEPVEYVFLGITTNKLYVSEEKVDVTITDDEVMMYVYIIVSEDKMAINQSENNNDYDIEDATSWIEDNHSYSIVLNNMSNGVQSIINDQSDTYAFKFVNGKIICTYITLGYSLEFAIVEV